LPPTEEGIGKSGSSCAYGGVTLQIDFLTPQEFEDMVKANVTALATAIVPKMR
jgi:hypothetical protein